MKKKLRKIMLARHYGFCMGVKRAIKIAEETGGRQSGPVNVIHEIVHNDAVVEKLNRDGVGVVSSVNEAPIGTVIVSAHGAPPSVFEAAEKKGLKVIDATCPLVIRIHKFIRRLIENDYQIIHFGDRDHVETIGVVGQAPEGRVDVIGSIEELKKLKATERKYAFTSQTTAEVADFERVSSSAAGIIPDIEIFNTICNATGHRQAAVLDLAPMIELMLVVGSNSSANSNRLCNISKAICGKAYLINSVDSLEESWLDGITAVGLTAGASTPDFLVEEVISWLIEYSDGMAELIRPEKNEKSEKSSHGQHGSGPSLNT